MVEEISRQQSVQAATWVLLAAVSFTLRIRSKREQSRKF